MSIDETFREKYRDEGYVEGTLHERKQTIRTLELIAEAPDVEAALHATHERLVNLQAKESSARAATSSNASEARAAQQINNALSAGRQPLDNGDLVAAAMNLPAPAATPAGSAATGAQPIDDMDRVAAAMAR